jgi:hypothetical protein
VRAGGAYAYLEGGVAQMSEDKLKPIQHVYFYLLWIVSGALNIADWLALRAGVSAIAAGIAESVSIEWQIERQWFLRWPASAVDKVALVVFGIAAIVIWFWLDYYYRNALVKGVIGKRFGKVTGIQVGLLIISLVVVSIVSLLV